MTVFADVRCSLTDDLADVRRRVESALAEAAAVVGVPDALVVPAPGKQLRPALLLLVSRLLGGEPRVARQLAAAVELVHAASLVHDDVMDGAETRRGAPTAARTLGCANAVLFGDVVFTRVFKSLVDLGMSDCLAEVARASSEICAGEVRQNLACGEFTLGRAEYLRIIELKTASLYRTSAALGALSGGAGETLVETAGRFGRLVGMAFQAADDLLDVAGDSAETGKPVGRDLAECKVTLPAILLLESMDVPERARAIGLLSAGDQSALRDFAARMAGPDTTAAVRAVAGDYAARALDELDGLPDGVEKEGLAALARFAADRRH